MVLAFIQFFARIAIRSPRLQGLDTGPLEKSSPRSSSSLLEDDGSFSQRLDDRLQEYEGGDLKQLVRRSPVGFHSHLHNPSYLAALLSTRKTLLRN